MYNSHEYVPAIDSLRALAVVSVIINHFNDSLLPSGYLGVDIFFVISGFVISSSLINRQDKTIREFLFGFYKRRIKRLTPALLFFFVITSITISFFSITPKPHILTGVFSLFGLSNISLYVNAIDYWGISAKINPFTHTWSLGVEEQFYFIFPLLVWILLRGQYDVNRIRRLQWLMFVISLFSLLSFLYFFDSKEIAIYFLMPFRFWEIGVGCALFFLLKRENGYYVSAVKFIPSSIFLIALISILFVPKEYSMLATAAVVFSTFFLITKIKEENNNESTFHYILTNQVFVYIGKISYSLYLWHWSVIAISRWTIGIYWWTIPFQILLIVLLAIGSYNYIEKPLRYKDWSSRGVQSFLIVLLAIGATLFPPLIVNSESNFLYMGKKYLDNDELRSAPISRISSPSISKTFNCKFNDAQKRDEKQKIKVIGNSHANHIIPMLKIISKICGVDVVGQKHLDYIVIPSGDGKDIGKLDQVLSGLKKGDILILSSRNRYLYSIPYLHTNGDLWHDHTKLKRKYGYGLESWLVELDNVIDKTNKMGVNVILFLPNVEFDQPVLKYDEMCRDEWFRILPQGCNPMVSKTFLESRFPKRFYEEVQARVKTKNNFYTFDPLPIYCPKENKECYRIVQGVVAFDDTHHLSAEGAVLMFEEFSSFLVDNHLIKNCPCLSELPH